MATQESRRGGVRDGHELINEIQGAGYKPVDLQELPEGIVIYQASEFSPVRMRGIMLARVYAINEEGLVGWPQFHRTKVEERSRLNPVEMALRNLQGRHQFIHEGHNVDPTAYLLKVQGKMIDSLGSQRRTP
ncbi:hypothetical protein HYS94_04010 [Candidatus Daviesbacteria bacterium]|nr:hypothetical protein [Candidatus Daviesbacteria bacterium]